MIFFDGYEARLCDLRRRMEAAMPMPDNPWRGATSWDFGQAKAWGDGPWVGEPDKVHWVDHETGLHCVARRGMIGNWCGYVAVKYGHPLHGLSYDEAHEVCKNLDVHGGLTFAGARDEDDGQDAIGHFTDDAKLVWWLGFDTCHGDDFMELFKVEAINQPVTEKRDNFLRTFVLETREKLIYKANRTYKDINFVRMECENLAQQIKAAAS